MDIFYNISKEQNMCFITSTELKNNLSHYLELSCSEDVYVTKNKKVISVLTSPLKKAMNEFLDLQGVLETKESKDSSGDNFIEEVAPKKCGF